MCRLSPYACADHATSALCRSPPCPALVLCSQSTFSRPDLAREEIAAECASAPPFAVLTVADLLPHDAVAGYEAAGGDVL